MFKLNRGNTLVEVVVGAAIITVFILAIIKVFSNATTLTSRSTHNLQSAYLAEEGLEALRSMRDFGWQKYIAPLNTGTNYYLTYATSSNQWLATTTSTMVGIFERKVLVSNVYRGSNDTIASSGTLDSNTKLFTVVVSWRQGNATTSKQMALYLTNLFSN